MRKKRILFVGEASFLNTGFSTYYRELLPRLVETGKYEIGEIGCYARPEDPRIQDFIQGRWKFYHCMPTTPQEQQLFNQPSPHPRARGQNTNQFGEWKFNDVVADFQPDIVVDIRDWWMLEYQERSVFRPWFKWVVMPTVDAEPQQEEWIQTYENANVVLCYSDYGIHTLRRQTSQIPTQQGLRPKMKILPKPMRPGVDLKTFVPMDRAETREHFNLSKDITILGTVMRNQSLASNERVLTQHGYKYADDIKVGDHLLTHAGRLMPVTNVWSYRDEKPYTNLQIFGNNIDRPGATQEHKFHFEFGKHAIGDTQIKERIKMPVMPLFGHSLIDIAEFLPAIDHWNIEEDKLTYDWRGGHAEVARYVPVDQDLMRLFGWYLAEGWISNHGKTVQFGLHTDEQDQCDEIVRIIKEKFGYNVTINDDVEFASRTLSWSSHIHAQWLNSLFGSGSRTKSIPDHIKRDPDAIHMAAAYLEGDGSFYMPRSKNAYTLAGSFSENLARDIRDILLSRGIFTTIGQSVDHDTTKTNLGIYGPWNGLLARYIRHTEIPPYTEKSRGCSWRNNVDWITDDDQSYFLVPVINVSHRMAHTFFYDFEVEEDYTYNCAGYACDNSRKLYPDLIDSFARMKNKYAGDPKVDKAALLIHSSWPDNQHSYDYPRHVFRLESYDWMPNHRKGIRGDILQSMKCMACGEVSITYAMNLWGKPLQDGRIKLPCPHCTAQECSPPNTSVGFSREELAKLYNLLDVYVQCSICEGDGMPIQEAKACGTPTLVTNYTAMAEKGRFPKEYSHLQESGVKEEDYSCHDGGEVINIGRYYYEPETSCKRALPDIDDLADKMKDLITDDARREKMSVAARKCVETNYDWNQLWTQWEFVLDSIKPLDRSATWDSPIEEHEAVGAKPIPEGMSDTQFVEWLYLEILGYPAVDPNGAKMWSQHLTAGATREQLVKQFVAIGNQQADAHRVREEIRAKVAGLKTQKPQTKTQEWL